MTLVVPRLWPGGDATLIEEDFGMIEVPVVRVGDINRHRFSDPSSLSAIVAGLRPDVVDLHEEPFSTVVRQVLGRLPSEQPVVAYAAQNIDKRFPPPFAQWERKALSRLQGIYPCTRQAASVAVGKGFGGTVRVLPLAPSPAITAGEQVAPLTAVRMLLVGRLVPEKGVTDAIRVLGAVHRQLPATLVIVGAGPEVQACRQLAIDLGVLEHLEILPWQGPSDLAVHYRSAHIVLAPSTSTRTWVEQFGRMVVEAQAAGAVVVGYASGSLPEVIGGDGVLVPEGDDAALARAVVELHHDPATWLRLREAGLKRAAKRSWDVVAAGQADLYEAMKGAGPPPPARAQRALAGTNFGEPALIEGGGRPFAIPLLRANSIVSRALADVIDRVLMHEAPIPPTKLRVVYIDHIAQLSGGELALARLISAMPTIEAHVILGEEGPLRGALEAAGATVEVLPLDPQLRDARRDKLGNDGLRRFVFTASYAFRLARRLRQLQPDVVHTNSLKSGFYGGLAARFAGLPVVWHLRDRIAADYLPRSAVVLTRFALRCLPDFVVCNSEETLRACGVARKRTGVHRLLPVKLRGWRVIGGVINATNGSGRVRSPGAGVVVGIVGRLAPWKGQDVFARAFSIAFNAVPEVRGRIIGSAMFGEATYEQSLRDLVQSLDLGDRMVLTGFSDDIPGAMADIDVLVHASVIAEPFGQVVLEGMAAGLPVVASAAGGPLEIITNGVDGLLTSVGDIDELATALSTLVANPEMRRRLGSSALVRSKDFGPEVIGAQWLQLYLGLLSGQRSEPQCACDQLGAGTS